MGSIRTFGYLKGKRVDLAILRSAKAEVGILSYGAAMQDWRVSHQGRELPMLLGFPRFEEYPLYSSSFGIVAGRVANRIANSRFTLNGQEYRVDSSEGVNSLHGGCIGLGRRVWYMELDSHGEAVRLSYHSPDGEAGFPGNVDFTVTYRLDGARVICDMQGKPDRPTPINLAQHNYYNLNGHGDIRRQRLQVPADSYTVNAPDLIPTGEIKPLDGTRFDFRQMTSFESLDPDRIGVDNNLVLREGGRDAPVAVAEGDETGIGLKLWSDEPGLQIYNAPKMNLHVPGHDAEYYGPFAGFCLEAQHYPDSVNRPDWPSTIRSPENPYRQLYTVEIA